MLIQTTHIRNLYYFVVIFQSIDLLSNTKQVENFSLKLKKCNVEYYEGAVMFIFVFMVDSNHLNGA